MQHLNVNLTIPIPADSVLISKVELEEFQQQKLTGVYWNMKDLEKRMNKSDRWIKDNVLFSPKFKRKLDSETGGCVYYPKSQGQTWSFQASGMAQFLDTNFRKIFS